VCRHLEDQVKKRRNFYSKGWLFPDMKIQLKTRGFADTVEMQAETQPVPDRITKREVQG
jgi:hypothetical protein